MEDDTPEISSPTPDPVGGNMLKAAMEAFDGRLALNQIETAKVLGVSVSTVRRLTRSGQLNPKRLPREQGRAKSEVGSLLYSVLEIYQWLHSPPSKDAA